MPKLSLARCVFASSVAVACLALPAGARAEDAAVTVHELDPKTGGVVKSPDLRVDYLNLGPILSLVGGQKHATGVGVEGSWMEYPTGQMPSFGIGAFFQAQLYDGKLLRMAGGAEAAAGPVGVEVGLAFRQGDGTYASTVALHTALFISIGYFYIAVRASPQLFALPTNEQSYALETAFTLGLKLPIAINGRDPTGYAVQAAGHAW